MDAPRPRRPVLIELAAAILIIGSATDAIISFEGLATAPTAEGRLLAAASVAADGRVGRTRVGGAERRGDRVRGTAGLRDHDRADPRAMARPRLLRGLR